MHGIVDEKTDIYAFGVLLLELITGRRALDESQQSLVLWVSILSAIWPNCQIGMYMNHHCTWGYQFSFCSLVGKAFARQQWSWGSCWSCYRWQLWLRRDGSCCFDCLFVHWAISYPSSSDEWSKCRVAYYLCLSCPTPPHSFQTIKLISPLVGIDVVCLHRKWKSVDHTLVMDLLMKIVGRSYNTFQQNTFNDEKQSFLTGCDSATRRWLCCRNCRKWKSKANAPTNLLRRTIGQPRVQLNQVSEWSQTTPRSCFESQKQQLAFFMQTTAVAIDLQVPQFRWMGMNQIDSLFFMEFEGICSSLMQISNSM